jgi:hypothetical protein
MITTVTLWKAKRIMQPRLSTSETKKAEAEYPFDISATRLSL